MKVLDNPVPSARTLVCRCLLGYGISFLLPSQAAPPPVTSTNRVPVISHLGLRGLDGSSLLALELAATSPGQHLLHAKIKISGAPSEVILPLGGIRTKETTVWTICNVKPKRTRPIYIRVDWRSGAQKGTSRFVVSPAMKPKTYRSYPSRPFWRPSDDVRLRVPKSL